METALYNRIYIAHSTDNTVCVRNRRTNRVIATIKIPGFPTSIAVNRETSRVYVLQRSANAVTIISSVTNSVVSTIDVSRFGSPIAMAVNSKTNRIYVLAPNNVIILDGDTHQVIGSFASSAPGTLPAAIAVNPTTNRIYVTVPSGVQVIHAVTRRSKVVPLPESPFDITLDRSSNRIYLISTTQFFVLNGKTNKLIQVKAPKAVLQALAKTVPSVRRTAQTNSDLDGKSWGIRGYGAPPG